MARTSYGPVLLHDSKLKAEPSLGCEAHNEITTRYKGHDDALLELLHLCHGDKMRKKEP